MKALLKKALAASSVAAFAAGAAFAAPGTDFDRGFDMEASMENFYTRVAESEPAFILINNSLKATTDCAVFAFKAGDQLVSRTAVLQSRVYRTVCEEINGEKICRDELLREVTRNAAVTLKGEILLLPWEKDVFRICLKDTKISSEALETAHRYELSEKPGPEDDYMLIATAVKKFRAATFPAGVSLNPWGLAEESGNLTLELKNKWAAVRMGFLKSVSEFADYLGSGRNIE